LDRVANDLKGVDSKGNPFLKSGSIYRKVPKGNGVNFDFYKTTRPTAWNGKVAEEAIAYAQRQYNA
jgi:hypothetical protein